MDPRHLELLRELDQRGTLAAVAAATHRTPSALSQQLRTAERECGVALVEPDGRGLRLTSAGQLLAEGADAVLAQIARLQARLDTEQGQPRGTVSIGCFPSAGELLLPTLARRLVDSSVNLQIEDFDLAEAQYATRTLDHDLVIGHTLTADIPAGAEGLVHRLLLREPIDVALPGHHPLADKPSLTPADLVGTEWIGVPEGYPFDTILIAVERLTEHRLQRTLRLRDNRLIEGLVVAGVGLALLPRFTTRPRDGLVLRPLVGVPASRSIVVLARPDRFARYAVRHVAEQLAEVGRSGGLDSWQDGRP